MPLGVCGWRLSDVLRRVSSFLNCGLVLCISCRSRDLHHPVLDANLDLCLIIYSQDCTLNTCGAAAAGHVLYVKGCHCMLL